MSIYHKIKGLNVYDYSSVQHIIEELLGLHGVRKYNFKELEPNIEYVLDDLNVVKLGDSDETLKFYDKETDTWSIDFKMEIREKVSNYYEINKINKLISNCLTGENSVTYYYYRLMNGHKEGVTVDSIRKELEVKKLKNAVAEVMFCNKN